MKSQNPSLARSIRTSFLVVASLTLVACASSPPDRNSERGAREGARAPVGPMARPLSLVFATMDADKDRLVSASELSDGINAEWAFADHDKNGSASVIEMTNWLEASLGSRDTLPNHLSFDKDLNGSITREEFAEKFTLEFEQLDADKDTQLSRSELFILVRARPQSGGQQNGSEGGRGRGGGGRGGRGRGGGRGG